MEVIKNKTYDKERALYNIKDTNIINCKFEGENDGESPLKEVNNINIDSSSFSLRYPLWHSYKFNLTNSVLDDKSRAPIWNCSYGNIENCKIDSIKALRECNTIKISNCEINSNEFGWKCDNLIIKDSIINSEYLLFDSSNLTFNNIKFTGKYSFQYIHNLTIDKCKMKTKDAFWNSNNIIITDSIIDGEYTGWYSNNLTFINCTIKGKQPFCYCTNLTLENCTLEDANDAFEFSDIEADIKGNIISIKNPKSGIIKAGSIGSITNEYNIKIVTK